jgi:hypothetical protein
MAACPACRKIEAMIAQLKLKPWKDGDPRCHCTHCDWCKLLFRTEDIAEHRKECPEEPRRKDALIEQLQACVAELEARVERAESRGMATEEYD